MNDVITPQGEVYTVAVFNAGHPRTRLYVDN